MYTLHMYITTICTDAGALRRRWAYHKTDPQPLHARRLTNIANNILVNVVPYLCSTLLFSNKSPRTAACRWQTF